MPLVTGWLNERRMVRRGGGEGGKWCLTHVRRSTLIPSPDFGVGGRGRIEGEGACAGLYPLGDRIVAPLLLNPLWFGVPGSAGGWANAGAWGIFFLTRDYGCGCLDGAKLEWGRPSFKVCGGKDHRNLPGGKLSWCLFQSSMGLGKPAASLDERV